ncbi:hypothetical protein G7081_01495 [Vagococcus coleopterorum]|uniref:Uncharacterized protein n=1 Tax=Vagococcus coleopterorum TaxID=2714946 RepID=A0A6G8ALH7_9ENTE|nr:hypothetical protein [Vagococcus coleopterorum]QIL45856.1 hypothetical protein G7081_01495 [Vagococcus coleopterorum]
MENFVQFFSSGEYLRDLSIALYAGIILWGLGIFYDRQQAARRFNEDKAESLEDHYADMLGAAASFLRIDDSYPMFVKDEIDVKFKMSGENFSRVLNSIDTKRYEKYYGETDLLRLNSMLDNILALDHNAYEKVTDAQELVHKVVKNVRKCHKGL